MTPAPRCLDDFLGQWALSRRIRHDDGSAARFIGTATWSATADGALCVERGTLTLDGGGAFAAERVYRWDVSLAVFFDDGRFFHAVPPEGGTVSHACAPDTYVAGYDFGAWPDWTCTWRVDGPRKAYTMVSRYRRAAA